MLDTIEDQMTVISCFVDDFFHAQPAVAQWRRTHAPASALPKS